MGSILGWDHYLSMFYKNLLSSFCVILLKNRPTSQQTHKQEKDKKTKHNWTYKTSPSVWLLPLLLVSNNKFVASCHNRCWWSSGQHSKQTSRGSLHVHIHTWHLWMTLNKDSPGFNQDSGTLSPFLSEQLKSTCQKSVLSPEINSASASTQQTIIQPCFKVVAALVCGHMLHLSRTFSYNCGIEVFACEKVFQW